MIVDTSQMDKARRKRTQECANVWLKNCEKKFKSTMDYTNTVYTGSHKKLTVKCHIHGDMIQTAKSHMKSTYGCKQCLYNSLKSPAEKFINNCKAIHNNKFDYSKSIYINNATPMIITCPEHGDFSQLSVNHLVGRGCQKCAVQERVQDEEFVLKRFTDAFGYKYNYDFTNYEDVNSYLTISCKRGHTFSQVPNQHIRHGCADCSKEEAQNLRKQTWLDFVNDKYNFKYDYSKFIFSTADSGDLAIGTIICPDHGAFSQSPKLHRVSSGCKMCKKITNEDYIEYVTKLHKDRYDYSLVDLFNLKDKKIEIICKKHNNKSFFQTPSHHYSGHGCLICGRKASYKEQSWILSFNNPNIVQGKFIRVNNKRVHPDGFDEITNTVYEFHGDFWHGNPKKYNKNSMNTVIKKYFGQLYDETIERENSIKSAGYKLVTMWESDFDKMIKEEQKELPKQ